MCYFKQSNSIIINHHILLQIIWILFSIWKRLYINVYRIKQNSFGRIWVKFKLCDIITERVKSFLNVTLITYISIIIKIYLHLYTLFLKNIVHLYTVFLHVTYCYVKYLPTFWLLVSESNKNIKTKIINFSIPKCDKPFVR